MSVAQTVIDVLTKKPDLNATQIRNEIKPVMTYRERKTISSLLSILTKA